MNWNMITKTNIKNVYLIKLRSFSDRRGTLSVADEAEKELPFKIKRLFFIYNVKKGSVRACHSTKIQQEALFCLNGSLEVEVDDGFNKNKILLDNPTRGLYIGRYVWRKLFNFSKDCVVLAICDTKYIKNDNITDYGKFLKIAQNKNT